MLMATFYAYLLHMNSTDPNASCISYIIWFIESDVVNSAGPIVVLYNMWNANRREAVVESGLSGEGKF